MKVCPKCNSTYSDETLNFCLTDGVPLVVEENLDEYLSKQSSNSWHTAETLIDPRFSVSHEGEHSTSPNSSAKTLTLGSQTADSLNLKKTDKSLYLILGGILAVFVFGGGFWWYSNASNPNNKTVLSESTNSVPKHTIVPISPEQEAQIKKELTAFMDSWARTNEQKNTEAHLAHYANTLEIYYTDSSKDKNYVLADRLRAYQKYDTIQIQIDNLKITPESPESATLVFDKSWTMKNPQKTATGSVQQEMHVTKKGSKWLIDAEKDAKVYNMNNREYPAADNTNQANTDSITTTQPSTSSEKNTTIENSNVKR